MTQEIVECPECGNILDLDGVWEEGALYSCDVCGTFWKYSNIQQKWIVDDPLRKKAVIQKVIVIGRPDPQQFQASIGISGPLLQLDVLGYLAEQQAKDKKDKQKVRTLRGQTGKPSKNRKHLDKQTQKLKNYRRK